MGDYCWLDWKETCHVLMSSRIKTKEDTVCLEQVWFSGWCAGSFAACSTLVFASLQTPCRPHLGIMFSQAERLQSLVEKQRKREKDQGSKLQLQLAGQRACTDG